MDLLQLVARLSLDSSEYESGISSAKSGLTGLGSAVKSSAKVIAGATVAGVTAATAAVGALTQASLSGYGSYQQLVGGVQKLYGNMGMSLEDYAYTVGKSTSEVKKEWYKLDVAQKMVLDNAKNAYRTTGMSANQYMETATSFSAALINSLNGDTIKAAKQTDIAMKAISDNWNTFGGDLGMIQYAYQGFAKQNYTMLDNLKLGYGGTKKEMERLIQDANEYAKANGQAADLSINSFSDIITAIDLIQQKQHIAGTTSREAATTIEGSFGSVRAAWDNLVAGFADPDADISKLVQDVVESASKAGENMIPAFTQALNGIGKAMDQILPQVVDKIPEAFDVAFVPMVKAGGQLITGVGEGIVHSAPQILSSVKTALSEAIGALDSMSYSLLSSSGLAITATLFQSIGEGISHGVRTVSIYFTLFLDEFSNMISNMAPTVSQAITSIFNNLDLTDSITNVFSGMFNAVETLLEANAEVGTAIMESLGTAIQEGIPTLLESVLPMVTGLADAILENAGIMLEAGFALIQGLANGIVSGLPILISYIPRVINSIVNFLVANVPKVLTAGIQIISTLAVGILQAVPVAVTAVGNIIKNILNIIVATDWEKLGSDIITYIESGINALAYLLPEAMNNICKSIAEFIVSVDWASVGMAVIKALAASFKLQVDLILVVIKGIVKLIINTIKSSPWAALGRMAISALASGISSVAGRVKSIAKNMADKVKTNIKTGFDKARESAVKAFEKIKSGISEKIQAAKDKVKSVIDTIKGYFPFNVGKIFTGWIPKIKLWTNKKKDKASTDSSVGKTNFAKAMEQPYMFRRPTEFYAGEAGDEILYGKRALMNDIASVVGEKQPENSIGRDVQITNYITIEGAENPEDFAERFIRKLRLDMRTA